VRAAEDILALTRALKEAWLFGRLDTLGRGERVGAEESARGVLAGLRALAGEGGGAGE
ncbi:hypothetical protein MMC18_005538, partial [Xylographa bjoerkii]|nr:hypothetical protein [Xylographa bjoerkii]